MEGHWICDEDGFSRDYFDRKWRFSLSFWSIHEILTKEDAHFQYLRASVKRNVYGFPANEFGRRLVGHRSKAKAYVLFLFYAMNVIMESFLDLEVFLRTIEYNN